MTDQHDARPRYYRGAGVFDATTGELRAGDGLLVAGGRVAEVGPPSIATDATVVELGDGVILPGFVDSHTHITIRPWEGDQHGKMLQPPVWQTIRGIQNMRRALQAGTTTAKIMTEPADIDYEFKDAATRGEIVSPRLRVCGPGLTPPGGHGHSAGGGVSGVENLRTAVRERAAKGADHIKIFTTGGVSSTSGGLAESLFSPEEIAAIVTEAAEHGLTVSAHAHGGPGVTYAVENGIHTIEHGAMLDAENIEAMRRRNTWLVMTHAISHHPEGIEAGDAHEPAILAKLHESRAYAAEHIHEVREAGLRVAVGTDSMHGLIGYEMVWMVEHGWSPAEALQAGTVNGAELMGLDDIGVLKPGARADFVVLRGDPLDDIHAVYDVAAVHLDGAQVVDGQAVIPAVPEPRRHVPTRQRA